LREGFITKPNVTWDDIGALDKVREELQVSICDPINNPNSFLKLGLSAPTGVLLYGPPGCGKTLLAKAIANECGANYISVKGPELLNKYVGESEKAVRLVYERAKASSPCIIFFDELDSLCPKREGNSNNGTERVVNQLLTEMDGIETRKKVYVIGATNRPDIIDSAMLRPGRLDKLIYVPLPDEKSRIEILKKSSKRTPLNKDVDLSKIGKDKRCLGFSGADLNFLVREAALFCYREEKENENPSVKMKHFQLAFNTVKPSVKNIESYEKMRINFENSVNNN